MVGNPPWDCIKLQQVAWFAERNPAIAPQPRAAGHKKMIAALQGVSMTQTGIDTRDDVLAHLALLQIYKK